MKTKENDETRTDTTTERKQKEICHEKRKAGKRMQVSHLSPDRTAACPPALNLFRMADTVFVATGVSAGCVVGA